MKWDHIVILFIFIHPRFYAKVAELGKSQILVGYARNDSAADCITLQMLFMTWWFGGGVGEVTLGWEK